MAETYPCPVEGCDHAPFKTPQALGSHISTDIIKKASYGACDTLALKQFKAIVTVNLSPPRRPGGNNSSFSSSFSS